MTETARELDEAILQPSTSHNLFYAIALGTTIDRIKEQLTTLKKK